MRSAMACQKVNKMYSPFKTGEFDLETLEDINELVYLSLTHNNNLNCYAIFNQIPTTGTVPQIINDVKDLVKSFEYIQPAQTLIYNRMSIQQAATYGLSVVEYEEERRQKMPKYRIKDYLFKGSLEMCSLYKEMFGEDFACDKFETLKEYLNTTAKETA
jgi:chromosome partitioning protein